MATSPAMVVLEAAVAFMAALSSFFACSTLPCMTIAASAHAHLAMLQSARAYMSGEAAGLSRSPRPCLNSTCATP